MGARKLCNDHNVIPIRGQVIKVLAPWIKSTFYDELDTYIIPGVDGTCTLGGTRNFESTRTDVCMYDAKSIRERCETILPSLINAKTLEHVVGLRPHRDGGVRVEIEKISNGRHNAIVRLSSSVILKSNEIYFLFLYTYRWSTIMATAAMASVLHRERLNML